MDESRDLTWEEGARVAEVFRLLGEPSRLMIVTQCLGGALSVNEFCDRLGLSQPLVSHHLKLLREARLLTAERQGRQVFYRLPDCHVRSMLVNTLAHLLDPHEHKTTNRELEIPT